MQGPDREWDRNSVQRQNNSITSFESGTVHSRAPFDLYTSMLHDTENDSTNMFTYNEKEERRIV